jgi:DNA-binding MarR family transcriptional regulator
VQAITGTTTVGRDLSLLLKHLMSSTNREFFAELQDAGISFSQLKCLGLLSNAEAPLSLGALSAEIGLSLAAVSRAVDGLVQRGELKRQEDPCDRRSKLVTVSARGRATYERVVAVRVAGVERFVEGLEPDEREALGAAVGPIVERLGR